MKLTIAIYLMLITISFLYCDQVFESVYVNQSYSGIENGTITNPYSSIYNALYATRNEPVPYELILVPGIYPEGINIEGYMHPRRIRSLYSPGNEHYISETIIQGTENNSAVTLRNCFNISIIGLSITTGWGYEEPVNNLIAKSGGGIYAKNVDNLNISSCYIHDNYAFAGGGVYLDVSMIAGARIENCKIYNNHSYKLANSFESGGAGIFINRGRAIVKSCQIFDNIADSNDSFGGGVSNCGYANVYFVNSSETTIENSLIYGNSAHNYGSGLFFSFYLSNINDDHVKLSIVNTNIVNNNNNPTSLPYHAGAYLLLGNPGYNLNSETVFNIKNSIFWENKYDGNYIDNQLFIGYFDDNNATNPQPDWVDYNYIQRRIADNEYVDHLVIGENNIGDQLLDPSISPHFMDIGNHDYNLRWDVTTKSPCIDSGYPEQFDVLYDRPDIGAIQFDGFPHYTYSYTFPDNGGIKWMSFPVLYRSPDTDKNRFTQFLEPLILDESPSLNNCEWNSIYDFDNNTNTFAYNGTSWQPYEYFVTSQQGYKFTMLNNTFTDRVVEVSGVLPPPQTQIRIYGPHQIAPNVYITPENWVGYYSPKIKTVFEAFENVMDNLYYIQKQDWSMMRDPSLPARPWLMPTSKPPTVKPGDMFIVKAYQDVNLIWNYEGPPQDEVRPTSAEHFEFVEKIDYVPIFTNFKGSNIPLPKEIAVYINGICKGAAVVTDSLAQICAYICEDLPANPQLDFVLYYDNKSQGTIADYRVWNPSQNSFVKEKLIANGKADYYLVNIINNSQGETPLPRLYLNNYPNPFNPRTTVTYYLPKNDRVKVSIYNAKGQLVKTLVNEFKYAGMQEIVWQGDDNTGSRCASGVYYCKLQYKNKAISNKLVLMK